MDLGYSPKTKELMARLSAFMDEHVYPNEKRYHKERNAGEPWPAVIEELKPEAKKAGL